MTDYETVKKAEIAFSLLRSAQLQSQEKCIQLQIIITININDNVFLMIKISIMDHLFKFQPRMHVKLNLVLGNGGQMRSNLWNLLS